MRRSLPVDVSAFAAAFASAVVSAPESFRPAAPAFARVFVRACVSACRPRVLVFLPAFAFALLSACQRALAASALTRCPRSPTSGAARAWTATRRWSEEQRETLGTWSNQPCLSRALSVLCARLCLSLPAFVTVIVFLSLCLSAVARLSWSVCEPALCPCRR